MNMQVHRYTLFVLLLVCWQAVQVAMAQDSQPQKYALLVGVTDYAKPELNTGLKFPEKDASDLAEFLRASGFEVDVLLGKQATRKAIKAKLDTFSQRGKNEGVIFVGLCGHGTESADTKQSYFCPYDTAMRAQRDPDGKAQFNNDGTPKMEFVPDSMLAIDDVLVAFGESQAANRILVADCCRDDPNRARGRSFGSSLTTDKLPIQTLMLLGCSSQQKSLEHDDWQHGALTKCLLDQMQLARNTSRTMGSIADEVIPSVEKLVASMKNSSDKQKPRLLSTGRVEILLGNDSAKPNSPWTTSPKTMTNNLGMKLVRIDAGEFMMGNEDSVDELIKLFPYVENYWFERASKRHLVKITQPYYMGAHEVTVGQFRRFVEATGYKTEAEADGKGGYGIKSDGTFEQSPSYTWQNPGFSQNEDHPVVNVSWNDAVKFCEWMSREDGQKYRLPTEAEWEYACRAGTRTRYWHGDDPEGLTTIGNVADATAKSKYSNFTNTLSSSDRYANTAPLGSFRANAWGLHDMHGNVLEWCSDWYGDYPSSAVSDPSGPTNGSLRVIRGGSWNSNAGYCRSADRNFLTPDRRNYNRGFRVAVGR